MRRPLLAAVTAATDEQARGIPQVGVAVDPLDPLDQATQQNAALVEESTVAAASLGQQAATRVAAVGAFRLDAAGIDSR